MEQLAVEKVTIGKADGIFWISLNDFFRNFDHIYLCRFFDKDYKELFFDSMWSKEQNTVGGCRNNDSYQYNPQMLLDIRPKSGSKEIEVYMQLSVHIENRN